MFRNLRWTAFLALLVAGAAACSDNGTGPSGGDFDPQATEQATENLQARLNSDSDILVSLGLAADGLAQAGAVSMVMPVEPGRAPVPMSAQVLRGYASAGVSAEPVFPSNLLGVTFEWSFDLGRYEPTARAGAPADGVRFILYAIDPLTRQPAEPLNEVGFLDLTDEGDAAATRLGIYAESGGTPLVDYFIEASYALLSDQDFSVTASAEGYVSDGSEQLDFLLEETATFLGSTGTIGLDVSYWLSLAGEDVSVSLEIGGEFDFSGENPVDAATARLTIQNGSDTAVFNMTLASDNTLDGVITYNGAPAILIGGTEADPVFTRADGEPLASEDVAALLQLFNLLDDVFEIAENLFQPFGGIGV
ncbi:MAG: hypothetical protein Q8W46_10740 [Candidatus Palauibacterales bacterium]|nr:hypothetical protein [Candidatus Palauibacterales bacterium]